MQNRMDKYSVDLNKIGSRAERNKALYESVKNSSMENYEIKSNVSVIDEDVDSINVNNIRKILDEHYSDSSPKRKSIDIPEFEQYPITIDDPVQDTKEYDINAILTKAKQGKNVDYNKERLKKVRETQYEILNNLDVELKKVENTKSKSQEEAENNLMNLINTITELENKNKETSTDLDLLSDLSDEDDTDVTEPNKVDEINLENTDSTEIEETEEEEDLEPTNEIRLVKITDKPKKESIPKVEEIPEIEESTPKVEEKKVEEETKEEKVEKTLTKLDINVSKYDEFADISKSDKGSIVLKIIIFIIIVVLVLGAIYILNDILSLGLF